MLHVSDARTAPIFFEQEEKIVCDRTVRLFLKPNLNTTRNRTFSLYGFDISKHMKFPALSMSSTCLTNSSYILFQTPVLLYIICKNNNLFIQMNNHNLLQQETQISCFKLHLMDFRYCFSSSKADRTSFKIPDHFCR